MQIATALCEMSAVLLFRSAGVYLLSKVLSGLQRGNGATSAYCITSISDSEFELKPEPPSRLSMSQVASLGPRPSSHTIEAKR